MASGLTEMPRVRRPLPAAAHKRVDQRDDDAVFPIGTGYLHSRQAPADGVPLSGILAWISCVSRWIVRVSSVFSSSSFCWAM